MSNIEVFEHSGDTCPVPGNTKVRYRTIDKDGCISTFWHHPVEACFLIWGSKGLGLGRIYDYFVTDEVMK